MAGLAMSLRGASAAAIGAVLTLGCVARAEEKVHPPIRELLVKANDFNFSSRDTVESGLLRIRMENVGKELHHMQLIRLDSVSAEQVLERARKQELVFPGIRFVGGPSTVSAGANAAEVVVDLLPGRYLMVCYMTSGKVRHMLMGMARELLVVPSTQPGSSPPLEDERMLLRSYSFEIDSVLKPGHHVIRVENESEEPHELAFARVPEGGSVEAVMSWLRQPKSPPPFEEVGGTMVLSKGEVAYVPLDLKLGQYVLMCFVPDSKDGLPHFAHGMVRVVTVAEETVADWNQAREQRGKK